MAINKIINVNDGSGREFTENTVAELKFDTKPEVGSFNAVTSDAVARAVAGASGEVPQVTESDNGKVLKAIYDEGGSAVEWGDAPSGVPEYSTTEDGKVLGVVDNSGTAELQWVAQQDGSDVVWVEMFSATFQEVWDAAYAGKVVYAYAAGERPPTEYSNIFNYYKLSYIEKSSWGGSSSFAVFERVTNSGSDINISTVRVDGDDQWSDVSSSGTLVPSYSTSEDGKVLGVVDNSGTAELQWVSAGGSVDQPLPAVATNTLRFEFENMSFDPTTSAEAPSSGVTWTKVSESVTRNIWDCTITGSYTNLFSYKFENTTCSIIDGGISANLTAINYMFYNCKGIIYAKFKVSDYVTGCNSAFKNCVNLVEVDIRFTRPGIPAQEMFSGCTKLTKAYVGNQNPSAFQTLSNCYRMFDGCVNLVDIGGFIMGDGTSTAVNCDSAFHDCISLTRVDHVLTSAVGAALNISSAKEMFSGCRSLSSVGALLVVNGTDASSMFRGCWTLRDIGMLDLNNTVTNASYMFAECFCLNNVNIVNSRAITNASYMFDMSSVTRNRGAMVKLPNIDTYAMTNVTNMFKQLEYADGALAMYQQMSRQPTPPTTTTGCFTDCGSITNATALAQIPSSWGGTGA